MSDTVNIQLPRDLYDRLVAMAGEIKTQDNRCTTKPYFYQVQEPQRIYGMDESYSDGTAWYDGCETGWDDDDPNYPDVFKKADEEWEGEVKYEGSTWTRIGYKDRMEYKGAFFTEKGIQSHMQGNAHHYHNKCRDFLQAAWRNPEMKTVFELFEYLAK